MKPQSEIAAIGVRALAASRELAQVNSRKKNNILRAIADELDALRASIRDANERDLEEGRQAGLSESMLERLRLGDARMDAMTRRMRDVSDLSDPIGTTISRWIRPNGLVIVKTRVPIGVVAIIYESCPDVTVDATALCLKSSNAIILRGGREAFRTNRAITEAMIAGGRKKGLPEHAVQAVQTTAHAAVIELVQLEDYVGLAIPRGGEELIRAVTEKARVPVLKHFSGVCHAYVDESADQAMALSIVENAKCEDPSASNAIETVLVHEAIAAQFIPRLVDLLRKRGVVLKGGDVARKIVPELDEAAENEWSSEHRSMVLALRVVNSVQAAVDHINTYGTHHSDTIIAESEGVRKIFCRDVDSAAVYVNASTRFTDGAEFGMGSEIAITTDRLHARGPVGLENLTTYKYVVHGQGQVRK